MIFFWFMSLDAFGSTPKWIKQKRAKEEAERLASEKAHMEWYNSPEAIEERRLQAEEIAHWDEVRRRMEEERLRTYPYSPPCSPPSHWG